MRWFTWRQGVTQITSRNCQLVGTPFDGGAVLAQTGPTGAAVDEAFAIDLGRTPRPYGPHKLAASLTHYAAQTWAGARC